jgi:hypothetical protein
MSKKCLFFLLVPIYLLLFINSAISVSVEQMGFVNVNDIQVTPPDKDVPATIAGFSGKWIGEFKDSYGSQYHMLIVQKITENKALITCAFGKSKGWGGDAEIETWNKEAEFKEVGLFQKEMALAVTTPHKNKIIYKLKDSEIKMEVTITGTTAKPRGMLTKIE